MKLESLYQRDVRAAAGLAPRGGERWSMRSSASSRGCLIGARGASTRACPGADPPRADPRAGHRMLVERAEARVVRRLLQRRARVDAAARILGAPRRDVRRRRVRAGRGGARAAPQRLLRGGGDGLREAARESQAPRAGSINSNATRRNCRPSSTATTPRASLPSRPGPISAGRSKCAVSAPGRLRALTRGSPGRGRRGGAAIVDAAKQLQTRLESASD